ncbi:MAG: 3'-5' exonuclease [Acidobacteriia bacterium]|nr:3'-5' exonuclease [Terriglobia bacterium]
MRRWLGFSRAKESAAPAPAKNAPLDSLRYVVLDTELTSLDRRRNRLLSIGAIAMDGASIRLNEQFYRVVNPGVAVPGAGVLIHGLRPCDVENGEPMAQVLEELRSFLQGAVLVGHFVAIDLNVLRKEIGGAGHSLDNPAIDTARVHRWILRHTEHSESLGHQLETLDLPTVAASYHLDFEQAHHALDDAFLTARLWQKMIHTLQAMNTGTLGAVLRFARA